MSMGTADACAGGGSAVYGNIVTESAALKPAGCGAQVTEQAAKAWHSGTGLRAVRHRKPAAVTQAGYTYCQLRKTRTVSTIPAWARTSERRSLTIYMRACPRGHATPRCLILPEPQLPLAAQQFAGAELQSLDSPLRPAAPVLLRHKRRRGRRCRSLRPCNLDFRDSDRLRIAVTDGCLPCPGSMKTVGEPGAPSVNSSNPNSRRGRKARSPIRQGWVDMESIIIGIDVSKDRLDVAVRPSGEVFMVERNAAGLEKLVRRLRELSPRIVALEATGGFETVAAAALAGAALRLSIRRRFGHLPKRSASAPRRIRSTPASLRISPTRRNSSRAPCLTKRPGCWATLSHAGGRSLR